MCVDELSARLIRQWHRAKDTAVDGVSFTRSGTEPAVLRVDVYLQYEPERCSVAPELGKLLDLQVATRSECMAALWAYVKKHRLQDADDRSKTFRCDKALAAVFGVQQMQFCHLNSFLNRYLGKPPPVRLEYALPTDREGTPIAFDVAVEIEHPARAKLAAMAQGSSTADVVALDDQIAAMAAAIRQSRLKRDFLAAFADDPVGFLQMWTASQAADVGALLHDPLLDEDLRRADAYRAPWLTDAIRLNDGRRIVAGRVQKRL